MQVTLSYNERLNLRSLVGQYRGWTPGEVRRVWAIMDRLDLTDEEKQMVGYHEEVQNGAVRELWDAAPESAPEPKEFSINDRDVARIKTALAGFQHAGNDRRWVKPLLDLFLPNEEES